MVITQIFRWWGRRVGWILQELWNGIKAAAKLLGLLLIIIVGTILAFVGQLVLLVLGALVALCIACLKAFAWFTERLMMTTKWFGSKLNDYTESFYGGIAETFREQEDALSDEIALIIRAEKL